MAMVFPSYLERYTPPIPTGESPGSRNEQLQVHFTATVTMRLGDAETPLGVGSADSTATTEYVRCETQAWDPSAGGSGGFVSDHFTLEMHRDWAPVGYDRFMQLVRRGFSTDNLIYRTIPGFLVQFGVGADPAVQAEYDAKPLQDDPKVPGLAFGKGVLSFAGSGRNSRTTHMFFADAPSGSHLGSAYHERPIGRIIDRPEIIDQVRSPKLTVAFAQSSYILLTYRVVGASSRGTATVTSAHCSPSS